MACTTLVYDRLSIEITVADLADSSAWSEQFAVLIHSTWDDYRMLYHQVTYSLVTYTFSI